MNLGDFNFGEPIAFGTTGEKQFYYPGTAGHPNLQNDSYHNGSTDHLTMGYDTLINILDGGEGYGSNVDLYHHLNYNFDISRPWRRKGETGAWDTKQHWQSPGTAYGFNTNASLSHPYINQINANGESTSWYPGTGADPQSFITSQYLREVWPNFTNKLNPVWHTSLYSELLTHNFRIGIAAASNPGFMYNSNNLIGLNRFLKILFLGEHADINQPLDDQKPPFKMVPAGKPYVKFRIPGVMQKDGVPINTNGIEYFVLLDTENHHNGNTYDIYTNQYGTNANISVMENLSLHWPSGWPYNVNTNNWAEVLQLTFGLGSTPLTQIPTIIADFKNPTFNVDWEDLFSVSNTTAFAWPGQYNPNNEEGKAPNFGWHPMNGVLPDTSISETQYMADFSKMHSTYYGMGLHPSIFTIDNFFLQDYDFAGVLNINDSTTYEEIRLQVDDLSDNGFLNSNIEMGSSIINGLNVGSGEGSNLSQNESVEVQYKLYIMVFRLIKYRDMLQDGFTWSIEGNNQEGYHNADQEDANFAAFFNQPGTTAQSFGFGNYWSYPFVGNEHGAQDSKLAPILYRDMNVFKAMFGPIAPHGYIPKCGINYEQYFGIATPPLEGSLTFGNTNFVFNGGLDIGSIELIDSFLGFDTSALIGQFSDYSGFTGPAQLQNSIAIFDRELWKLFYDGQVYCQKIEQVANSRYEASLAVPLQTELEIPGYGNTLLTQGGYASNSGGGSYGWASHIIDPLNNNILFDSVVQWPFEDFYLNVNTGQQVDGTNSLSVSSVVANPNMPIELRDVFTSHANVGGSGGTQSNWAWQQIHQITRVKRIYKWYRTSGGNYTTHPWWDTPAQGGYLNYGKIMEMEQQGINHGAQLEDVLISTPEGDQIDQSLNPYFYVAMGGVSEYTTNQGTNLITDPNDTMYDYQVNGVTMQWWDMGQPSPYLGVFPDDPIDGDQGGRFNTSGPTGNNYNKIEQGAEYVFKHGSDSTLIWNTDENGEQFPPTQFGDAVYDPSVFSGMYLTLPDPTEPLNSDQAFAYKKPTDYNLGYSADILSPIEQQRFAYLQKVGNALKNWHPGASINQNFYYQLIIRWLINPNNPSEGVEMLHNTAVNPYIDDLYFDTGYSEPNFGTFNQVQTLPRDFLLNLPESAGGIANWQLYYWAQWLTNGCVDYFPNYAPTIESNLAMDVDVINEYGVFEPNNNQFFYLSSADANGYVEVLYTGTNIVGDIGLWDLCDYLNSFPELIDGAIDIITPSLGTGLETPIGSGTLPGDSENINELIYTPLPITLPNGTHIPKGFYPSNPQIATDVYDTFFTPGESFYMKITRDLQTSAFGPTPQTGYATGTSFIEMINQLMQDGIYGPDIDLHPYNENPAQSGDGMYSLQDGIKFLEIYGDTRPLQLIQYAHQNNLIDVLETFMPITTSPGQGQDAFDDLFPGDSHTAGSITLVQPPFKGLGVFDGVNNAVKVFSPEQAGGYGQALNNERSTGYFSEGPGQSGMVKGNNVIDNGYYDKDDDRIFGNQIFTQSLNSTNDSYYYSVVKGDPTTFGAEEVFDVSFGHYAGSGSLSTNNNKSPSEAIYRQIANEIFCNETGQIFSISESVARNGSILGVPTILFDTPYMTADSTAQNPDEYIYVLKVNHNKVKDRKFNNHITIKLKGKDSGGTASFETLTTQNIGTTPGIAAKAFREFKDGLRGYYLTRTTNLLDNPNNPSSTAGGVYGYWFPSLGVAIINNKIAEIFSGVGATTPVQFNASGAEHLGLAMNGAGKQDQDYRNALKLINAMKNVDTGKAIEDLRYEESPGERGLYVLACIRLTEDQFNYSTNPTLLSDPSTGTLSSFGGSMTYDPNGAYELDDATNQQNPPPSPTTYITHVDLYDNTGIRVATAKLSKPLKKDFNSRAVIKIMIKDF